jgi:ATP-dependent DNA helicase RecG
VLFRSGDLDISAILERPPGREPIDTKWLPLAKLEQAYALVGKTVMSGGRAYVICPQVEEEESAADGEYDGDEDAPGICDVSVVAQHRLITELLKEKIRPDAIGLLHGRLKPEQKNRVMGRFASGDVSVLVSTTVVEVGVDVPAANLIVIVGAERFGLAQLHQLRGRVGRGGGKSMCLLISDGGTEPARARLEVMRASQDGFFLADKDLELRGPGEILGIRQHGLPELRLARLPEDLEILVEARKKAETLLSRKGEGELVERLKLACRWYPAANGAIWADEP